MQHVHKGQEGRKATAIDEQRHAHKGRQLRLKTLAEAMLLLLTPLQYPFNSSATRLIGIDLEIRFQNGARDKTKDGHEVRDPLQIKIEGGQRGDERKTKGEKAGEYEG